MLQFADLERVNGPSCSHGQRDGGVEVAAGDSAADADTDHERQAVTETDVEEASKERLELLSFSGGRAQHHLSHYSTAQQCSTVTWATAPLPNTTSAKVPNSSARNSLVPQL